jgi:hypothetical protein
LAFDPGGTSGHGLATLELQQEYIRSQKQIARTDEFFTGESRGRFRTKKDTLKIMARMQCGLCLVFQLILASLFSESLGHVRGGLSQRFAIVC